MLLHEIREPTCLIDLKKVDKYVCETYAESCQRLGLLGKLQALRVCTSRSYIDSNHRTSHRSICNNIDKV